MSKNLPQLITSSVIAQRLRRPIHRVLYVLSSRQHIAPAAMAGTHRLYKSQAVAMVRHELNAIDARKSKIVKSYVEGNQ